MKVVLQRVSEASVTVDNEQIGAIDHGLMLLVGIHQDDGPEQMEWLADKILKLRIFDDEDGKMDITEHEKTFEGFIRFSVWTAAICIGILIFLALTNA